MYDPPGISFKGVQRKCKICSFEQIKLGYSVRPSGIQNLGKFLYALDTFAILLHVLTCHSEQGINQRKRFFGGVPRSIFVGVALLILEFQAKVLPLRIGWRNWMISPLRIGFVQALIRLVGGPDWVWFSNEMWFQSRLKHKNMKKLNQDSEDHISPCIGNWFDFNYLKLKHSLSFPLSGECFERFSIILVKLMNLCFDVLQISSLSVEAWVSFLEFFLFFFLSSLSFV